MVIKSFVKTTNADNNSKRTNQNRYDVTTNQYDGEFNFNLRINIERKVVYLQQSRLGRQCDNIGTRRSTQRKPIQLQPR